MRLQLLILSYGGTRRSLAVSLLVPPPSGSCSRSWSTISSPWCATASSSHWPSFSCGPMPPLSSTSEFMWFLMFKWKLKLVELVLDLELLILMPGANFHMTWFVVLLDVRSPPNIPEVKIPEDAAVNVAHTLRYEINKGFATLREIGHGRDLKKFLIVCLLFPWTIVTSVLVLCWYPALVLLFITGYSRSLASFSSWELLQFPDIILYW